MKALIMVLSLAFGFSAHAGVSIVKALDGSVAYCGQGTIPQGKIIKVDLQDLVSGDEQEDATMAVSLVQCENGQWVEDTEPGIHKYTAPNGERVTVRYTNFELFIVNQNYDVILQTELTHLNHVSAVDMATFRMNRNRDAGQIFQVIIRAMKHVEASGGQKFSDYVTFGAFNVRMTE